MRAARFMKYGAGPVVGVAMFAALIIGVSTAWYVGVILFAVTSGALFGFGYTLARCPHCGQVWWGNALPRTAPPSWSDLRVSTPDADETQSYVCRRCRLDIGLGLRE
jgi:hypothetical protein